jgi:hypothetical protein
MIHNPEVEEDDLMRAWELPTGYVREAVLPTTRKKEMRKFEHFYISERISELRMWGGRNLCLVL